MRMEWISVKDRLPEKDEYVFCYSNKYGGTMFIGYRGWYSGEWMEGGSLHIGDVTHWMQLPNPPTNVFNNDNAYDEDIANCSHHTNEVGSCCINCGEFISITDSYCHNCGNGFSEI